MDLCVVVSVLLVLIQVKNVIGWKNPSTISVSIENNDRLLFLGDSNTLHASSSSGFIKVCKVSSLLNV